MRLQPMFCAMFCAVSALLTPAAAQVVRGSVVDTAGAAVGGAFVAILNEQGQQRTAVLSGENGEYVFLAPPGRYSLRVELIGHQTETVPLFRLAERETRTDRVVLQISALKLPEISVNRSDRCDRVEASRETARVWSEARKVLTVAAWVGSQGGARFRYRRTERDLDLDLKPIRPPRITVQITQGQKAFDTAQPDSLSRFGYIQERPRGIYLYGPDAELLLSPLFLSEHCFGLRRSAEYEGLIGLTFQPLPSRRLPDISGVLWLDERSAALRFIEYGYTGTQRFNDRRYAGGRAEFQQLPNGAWIVNHWYIRAPNLGMRLRLEGAREEAGDVLDVQLAGRRHALVASATVEGVVFDSLRGAPLEGARVYLPGTPFFGMSGPEGRFRLDSIPAGEYAISFEHSYLDAAPVLPEIVRFRLDSSGVKELQLSVPTLERMIDALCPDQERERFRRMNADATTSNRGVIFGIVNADAEARRNLQVNLSWQRSSQKRADPTAFAMSVSLAPDGRYTLCSVPVAHPLALSLNARNEQVQQDSLRLLPPGLVRRDFKLRQQ